MEHYTPEKVVSEGGITRANIQSDESEMIPDDQEDKLFSGLGLDLSNVTTMRVQNGSKIRNLLGFAFRQIKSKETRHIIFTGSGPAISKTITCVEIVKRNLKTLHQVSKIFYKRTAEYWNPKEESLDRLKVTRHIPAIAVLLSKDHLNAVEPGYQAPGSSVSFLADSGGGVVKKTNKSRKRANSDKMKQGKKSAQSGLTLKSGDEKPAVGTVEGLRRKTSGKRSTRSTQRKLEN